MSNEFLPRPSYSRNKIKVKLDLSNYATKCDLEGVIGINKSQFAKTYGLASLKSKADTTDIDTLETVPNDLSKLSNIA